MDNARFSTEVEIQVPFFDLDPMDVVWHGNYVKYLEVARCALLDKFSYGYTEMKASGYMWPVIDLHVRYVGSVSFSQKIRIRATLSEWENRLRINYLITDSASGKRLTRATTTQVAIDIITREMCFVSPAVLKEKLGVT